MATEEQAPPSTSTDLVPVSDSVVLEAIKGGDVTVFVEDPLAISKKIVDKIVQAETVEAILSAGESDVLHAKENLERPFYVHDLRFANSQFVEESPGPRIFAIIEAEFLDDQEPASGPMTCGGMNVMAQLLRLKQVAGEGLSEIPVKIIEIEGKTAAGFKPLWLASP